MFTLATRSHVSESASAISPCRPCGVGELRDAGCGRTSAGDLRRTERGPDTETKAEEMSIVKVQEASVKKYGVWSGERESESKARPPTNGAYSHEGPHKNAGGLEWEMGGCTVKQNEIGRIRSK